MTNMPLQQGRPYGNRRLWVPEETARPTRENPGPSGPGGFNSSGSAGPSRKLGWTDEGQRHQRRTTPGRKRSLARAAGRIGGRVARRVRPASRGCVRSAGLGPRTSPRRPGRQGGSAFKRRLAVSADIARCIACGGAQRVLVRWPQHRMFRLVGHLDGNGHRCSNPTQHDADAAPLTDPEAAP